MAILNSCCCWKSLRKACYACAVYSLLYYLFFTTIVVLILYPNEPSLQDQEHQTNDWSYDDRDRQDKRLKREHPSVLRPVAPDNSSWNTILLQIGLAFSVLGTVTSIFLIIGIWKDKKLLLLPWIINISLMILHDLIYIGYLGYIESMSPRPEVAMVLTVDFFILILNCYSILCVISQFQEYKDGRGRSIDERPVQSVPSTMNSCETGRRNVTVYESKSQANGISPRQSRMSFRNPSIKISRVDKNNVDESQIARIQPKPSHAFDPRDSCARDSNNKNFSISDCLSTPATSSTSGASETSSIQHSECKKKCSVLSDSERDSSSADPAAYVSETSATTECESSSGRDWATDKSLENSPLIRVSNQIQKF